MQAVTTIGLDIAKSVFQIHGVHAAGNVVVRRRLKRRYVLPFFQKLPPCLGRQSQLLGVTVLSALRDGAGRRPGEVAR